MRARLLLRCLLICSACFLVVFPHIVMEEKTPGNDSCEPSKREEKQSETPAVLIVELPKISRKSARKSTEKKPKQNKLNVRNNYQKPRPPPPANCVPLWGSCKPSSTVCCEHCAFCHCRLFKTVCYCRMGSPGC
ncbi:agouti signaling protein 1 [Acipenser ruthenus]|uniref:agouti signaling protein 1 n=1 Tax=Acipenser ruthenus TaxID=7906 RepID=UPI00145A8BB4|nr:agouti signaling protein 1 [Acipenser ruthenus]